MNSLVVRIVWPRLKYPSTVASRGFFSVTIVFSKFSKESRNSRKSIPRILPEDAGNTFSSLNKRLKELFDDTFCHFAVIHTHTHKALLPALETIKKS